MKVICQYCNKEIHPAAVAMYHDRIVTKYHEGCRIKVAAEKAKDYKKSRLAKR